MVVHGEVDDQRWHREPGQLTGRHYPVITVGSHPCGQGKPRQDEQRRHRTPNYAQPGMTLAHVVQEGRHDDVAFSHTGGYDCLSGVEAMTLVGVVLGEEHIRGRCGQPVGYCGSFRLDQGPCGRYVEETSEQVGRRARQFRKLPSTYSRRREWKQDGIRGGRH
jgi:hypothetical protein